MNKNEATKIRDENRKKLIGKPFDGKRIGWDIKDVIISDNFYVFKVYSKMYDGNLTNDQALKLFEIDEDNLKVYVISHQWPWGSGDLLSEDIESYMKHNPI